MDLIPFLTFSRLPILLRLAIEFALYLCMTLPRFASCAASSSSYMAPWFLWGVLVGVGHGARGQTWVVS